MNLLYRLVFVIAVVNPATTAEGSAYQFINIADTTMMGPTGSVYTGFGSPSISQDTVAFVGSYVGGWGVFTSSGSLLKTIAKKGDPGPTRTFYYFTDASISGSNVAFVGSYDDPGRGIFVGSGGPLTTIVKTGDAGPRGVFNANFGPPAIDGDIVAFAEGRNAIYTGDGGFQTLIAQVGDIAPIGTFGSLSDPALSGNRAVFVGHYGDDSLIGSIWSGIFSGSGGPLQTIVKTGDAAPVGAFQSFFKASASGNAIAFLGSDSLGYGVFEYAPSSGISTVARIGDAAPLGVFYDFLNVQHAGSMVAFLGAHRNSETSKLGIFLGNGGPLTTVIETGDPLFGSTIESFEAFLGGTDQFAIDAHGTGSIAFAYTLADGRRGIALASPVPEPMGVAVVLITAAAIGVGGNRSRRT